MPISTSLRPHLTPSYGRHYFKLCSLRVHGKHKKLSLGATTARCCALHGIDSVLGDRRSSINSNGVPEPARALLERLFGQTQKLEEQMNGDCQEVQSDFDLENLEFDLQAILKALRKREEDLLEADKVVKLEHAELSQAREELERREMIIAVACSKQEKLEEEQRQANLNFVSQARHIEDLKLQLSLRDQEITAAKSAMSSKESEIDKMWHDLARKNEETAKAESQLKSKAQLLDEAHAVVKKQEIELQVLRTSLQEKKVQLEEVLARQQFEEEKMRATETKLEKQTMQWLLAQEELKKLGEQASKHFGESKETMDNFQRVKRLLADVRIELVSSQQSLVTSRQKMAERELLLEKQFLDLEEQKELLVSYINSLKAAHIEVESGRAKLRVAEARNKELELDLSLKRKLIRDLQEELEREKSSLQHTIHDLSSLQEELSKKNIEFEETINLLEIKESELVEARLEMQHLKSEQQSLKLILQDRDLELVTARKRLEEVNREVTELRMVLNGQEDQLIITTDMLKEKEAYVLAMQGEMNDVKLRATEAKTVVGRIVDLTKELVISAKEDDLSMSALLGGMGQFPLQVSEKPREDYKWQKKQLVTELELTRENLKAKEMELLAAQRQLTIKDEELKMVLDRLDENDRKLKELGEEKLRDAGELKKLSSIALDGVGKDRLQELAIEKLQLEAAQLEVEAATSALQKLMEMSRQLLNKATLSVEADLDVNVFPQNGFSSDSSNVESNISPRVGVEPSSSMLDNGECLAEVKSEVARLSALTDRLVQEAGAVSTAT